MKILSLNRDHIDSEHRIALNLDQVPTFEFMELLDHGGLKLTAKGSVLFVEKAETSKAFSRDFVETLQRKLYDTQWGLDEKAKHHQQMKESMAERMGLPLV